MRGAMPHALLLSPDDQAVSAITGVLEEMSVTCERPLDGASAAQKLNAHSFDLVLVDCENLPAAKLIFDVCRRGKNGNNPVPIAIVDGRAGLPTAFRLGAELILTKPVAKDQARSTFRTAVNRLRKEEPARAAQPVEPASAEAAVPAVPGQLAQAAAAAAVGSVSSPAKTVEASAPAASPVTAAAAVPVLSEPAMPELVMTELVTLEPVMPKMSSAAAGVAVAPDAVEPAPAPSAMISPAIISSATRGSSRNSPQSPPRPPSDDPVLAELERAETEPEPAIFSSYVKLQESKKGRRLLVAALLVGL